MRFDDNVSFIDADADYSTSENTKSEHLHAAEVRGCEINFQTNPDDTSIKIHDNYSYDNVAGVNDEILPTVQRGVKVRILQPSVESTYNIRQKFNAPFNKFFCILFQGINVINASCTVTEETAEELAEVISPPIMRSHTQSSKSFETREMRNIDATDHYCQIKPVMKEELVMTTTTGSSIVSINQPDFNAHSHTIDVTNREDASTSSQVSKEHEICISTNDTTMDTSKHDHVTLLSVGDTQYNTDES